MTNFLTLLLIGSLGGNVAAVMLWSRSRKIER